MQLVHSHFLILLHNTGEWCILITEDVVENLTPAKVFQFMQSLDPGFGKTWNTVNTE